MGEAELPPTLVAKLQLGNEWKQDIQRAKYTGRLTE